MQVQMGTLYHEVLYDTMKYGVVIVTFHAQLREISNSLHPFQHCHMVSLPDLFI